MHLAGSLCRPRPADAGAQAAARPAAAAPRAPAGRGSTPARDDGAPTQHSLEPAARTRAGRGARLAGARRLPAAGRAWAAQPTACRRPTRRQAWGLLTPAHWQVGSDQIVLLDPAAAAARRRRVARAAAGACARCSSARAGRCTGARRCAGMPTHDSLARAGHARRSTASSAATIDRVAARPAGRAARCAGCRARCRCCCYTHPINDGARGARRAAGQLVLAQRHRAHASRCDAAAPSPASTTACARPLLADDWAAWAEAWQALDAQRAGASWTRAPRAARPSA